MLGEDFRWPQDFLSVAQLTLQLALLHTILHRSLFLPLARFCIPRPKTWNDSSLVQKDSKSQDQLRSWTPPPSPSMRPQKSAPKEPADDLETKHRKFATSCYKLISYSVLFFLGCYALINDDRLVAKMEQGRSWIQRGPISNFDDWPHVRLRYPQTASSSSSSSLSNFENPHQTDIAMKVSSVWTMASQWLWEACAWIPSSALTWTKDPASSLWMMPSSLSTNAAADTSLATEEEQTSPIVTLYQYVLAFYLWTSFLLAFDLEGPRQKDKKEMLLHHGVTMFLVLFSWYFKLFRIGAIILVLHDMSDPFMDLAKLLLYSGKQTGANISFGMFALSFLFGRCVLFPMTIVWPSISYLMTDEGWAKAQLLPGWYLPLGGLLTLQGLHIFWGALIVRMVVDALTKGDVGDDIRDEE